jgi:hypothetical protein
MGLGAAHAVAVVYQEKREEKGCEKDGGKDDLGNYSISAIFVGCAGVEEGED